MSAESIPPGLTAKVDQFRARLAELVQMAREHRTADPCRLPQVCPGGRVVAELNRLLPQERALLDALMVAELAELGYGLPRPVVPVASEPVLPCGTESARRRHLAHGQECGVCGA